MSNRRSTDHFSSLIDHDLLIEIKVKVEDLKNSVNQLKEDQAKRADNLEAEKASQADVDDHETRLRFIERYVWAALGVIGVLNFVGFGTIIWFLQSH